MKAQRVVRSLSVLAVAGTLALVTALPSAALVSEFPRRTVRTWSVSHTLVPGGFAELGERDLAETWAETSHEIVRSRVTTAWQEGLGSLAERDYREALAASQLASGATWWDGAPPASQQPTNRLQSTPSDGDPDAWLLESLVEREPARPLTRIADDAPWWDGGFPAPHDSSFRVESYNDSWF